MHSHEARTLDALDTRRARLGWIVPLVAVLGCRESVAQSRTATATPTAVVPDVASPASNPACGAVLADIRAALGTGGACTTATDCDLYPGGIHGLTNCGGPTDRVSAARIRSDTERARSVCANPEISWDACAAWSCSQTCEAGRCTCGPTPQPTPPPAPAPPMSARCTAIRTQYTDLVRRTPNVCRVDADCGDYTGTVAIGLACVGALPTRVATQLRALADEYFGAAHCPHQFTCNAQRRAARCAGGACMP